MKKLFSVFLMVLLAVSVCTIAFAGTEVTVKVDGKVISSDVAPQIISGRTMVPLRAIFETLGATVKWDDKTRSITATKKYATVECAIDSYTLSVNYVDKALDVAPMIVNSRTLVPARFVAEALGCNVEWDGAQRIVTITSPSKYYSGTDITSFTSVTGIPADSSRTAEDKTVYNTYEVFNGKAITDYINTLKNNGWTQAFVENDGDLIIEAYKSGKNLVTIIISFNQEYRVMDGTVTIAYTTNSGFGASNCSICSRAGQDLCQGHTCSVCKGRGEQTCNGCHGTGYGRNPLGIYDNKCVVCYGLGTQICPNCDGGGKLFYER